MKPFRFALMLTLLCSLHAWAAVPEGQEVPVKWFKKYKGYNEALEIQKQTGADILVYIANVTDSSKKGLCSWFEKKGLKNSVVGKFVKRNYIKVRLDVPSNQDTKELGESLYMSKGPSLVIIDPGGHRTKVNPFDWVNKKPKLKEANALVAELESKSSKFE